MYIVSHLNPDQIRVHRQTSYVVTPVFICLSISQQTFVSSFKVTLSMKVKTTQMQSNAQSDPISQNKYKNGKVI